MPQHLDDIAFLDARRWEPGHCVLRDHRAGQTTEVGHVAQGSGAGFPVMVCRECLAYRLRLERAYAEEMGTEYVLRMPALA